MASPPPTSASEAQLALKIVFMGTPQLAAHILARLLDAPRQLFHVAAVVTRPDQPRGRGLRLEPSEVGRLAAAKGIPTLKPTSVRSPEFLAQLRSLMPDLLVIAAYGRILPKEVLEAARIMPINVHASLLPRFRGPSPIEAAILAGESETGITIMRVTERMDAGPLLLQRKLPLAADETQGGLKVKLAELGAKTLLEALNLLRSGNLSETEQEEGLASYTSPITKQHAVIGWNSDAVQIERMVRAYDPWPVARSRLGDDDLLIWRTRVALQMPHNEGMPGTILSLNPQPTVQCGRGTLELLEVQAAGRRRMAAADFMHGRHIAPGACLRS